jgi:zinc transporter, ZIP family
LKQGVLLTIALTLELFSLGLAMAVQFGSAKFLVRVNWSPKNGRHEVC